MLGEVRVPDGCMGHADCQTLGHMGESSEGGSELDVDEYSAREEDFDEDQL